MSEFPTGKPHVSFSEVSCWTSCGWKHKLTYIDKIKIEDQDWIHAEFGTHVHKGIEKYLTTKVLDVDSVLDAIEKDWISKKRENVETWKTWAKNILEDLVPWIDSNYPDWELIGSELLLYQKINETETLNFKGLVDCIIKVPLNKEKTKWKIWILDWKTGPAYGWRKEKLQDELVLGQLWLYKNYLMKFLDVTSRDISCAFVVLKKGAKKGSTVSKYEVCIGPKPMERGQKLLTDMVAGVRRGKFFKNKYSCEYCDLRKAGKCNPLSAN
jgi:hypothetical protein